METERRIRMQQQIAAAHNGRVALPTPDRREGRVEREHGTAARRVDGE